MSESLEKMYEIENCYLIINNKMFEKTRNRGINASKHNPNSGKTKAYSINFTALNSSRSHYPSLRRVIPEFGMHMPQ